MKKKTAGKTFGPTTRAVGRIRFASVAEAVPHLRVGDELRVLKTAAVIRRPMRKRAASR